MQAHTHSPSLVSSKLMSGILILDSNLVPRLLWRRQSLVHTVCMRKVYEKSANSFMTEASYMAMSSMERV